MTHRILTRLLLSLASLLPLSLSASGANDSVELRPQAAAAAVIDGSLAVDLSQPAAAKTTKPNSTPASPFPDDYEVIEPELWRVVRLTSPLAHGGTCEITLLRPLPWFEIMGVEVGAVIDMHMPEMGISGEAEVLTIGPCPEHVGDSEPGARPVTGRFVSINAPVLDLHIEGLVEPIGVTAGHPFWSLDRSGWIAAGDLQVGERLRTLDGEAAVEEIVPRSERETVYNIEVHRQHSYYVTAAKLWVHNTCTVKGFNRAWTKHGPHMADELIRKATSSTNISPTAQGWFVGSRPQIEAWVAGKLPALANGADEFVAPGFWGRVVQPSGQIEITNVIKIVPSGNGVKTVYPVPMR